MFQTLRDFNYSNEQIGLLLNSKPGTLGANLIGPLFFFSVYATVIPFRYIFVWLLLQLMVFLVRMWLRKRGIKAIEQSNQDAIRRYFIYYLGAIFSNALLWGLISILVLEYSSQTFVFFYVIALFGLGAAASSSLGVVFHAIAIFLTNTIGIALLVSLYYADSSVNYIFCVLIFLYLLFMLQISFRNHNFIMTNIEQKKEIQKSHSLIKESIEYAALIQKAMLPKEQTLDSYFKESFIYLKQRDIVGGDFYSVIPLSEDELLVMVLDGVGHGVSGAFMTMFIKATEQQIITEVHQEMLEAKPNVILSRFNALIKTMIQDHGDTKASIGFDGGLLYFNRKTSYVSYAGAKMPLYTIENNTLKIYKGDRKGIGFVRTPVDQAFKQYEIPVTDETKFYFVTDGILDQEGEAEIRFGQKRFEAFLLAHHHKTFIQQYGSLKDELEAFTGTKAQIDDATVLGFTLR